MTYITCACTHTCPICHIYTTSQTLTKNKMIIINSQFSHTTHVSTLGTHTCGVLLETLRYTCVYPEYTHMRRKKKLQTHYSVPSSWSVRWDRLASCRSDKSADVSRYQRQLRSSRGKTARGCPART